MPERFQKKNIALFYSTSNTSFNTIYQPQVPSIVFIDLYFTNWRVHSGMILSNFGREMWKFPYFLFLFYFEPFPDGPSSFFSVIL